MSHFTTVSLKIQDESALVSALTALGFKPEVHQEPTLLVGWYGEDKSENKFAQVIVRKAVSGGRSDIGFVRNEDGTYTALVDDYDLRVLAYNNNPFNLEKLNREYAIQVAIRQAVKMGANFQREGDRLRIQVPQRATARR
jgi:Protein of unknown function (DUF1257)